MQIPWEFQGQSSVEMKVTLYGYLWGDVYTVPLTTYSPGIFAVTDGVNNAAISAAQSRQTGRQHRDLCERAGTGRYAASVGRTGVVHGNWSGTNAPPTVTIGGSTGGIISAAWRRASWGCTR